MAEQGINPKEIAQLFVEKWPIILIGAAIGTGFGYRQSLDISPWYSAEATIQVDYQQSSVLSEIEAVESQDFSEYDVLNTIVETLNNTELMRQVILDNDLINNPDFAGPNAGSASIDRLAQTLSGRTRARLRGETRLIDITTSFGDEDLVQDLVNWIAQGYIKQHANRLINANKSATDVLNDEAERLKMRLRNAEIALIDFRRTSKMVISLQAAQGVIEKRVSELSGQLAQLSDKIDSLETDMELIKQFGPDADPAKLREIPSISNSQYVTQQYQAFLTKSSEVTAFRDRYKPKHPLRINAESELKEYELALHEAIREAPLLLEAQLARLRIDKERIEGTLDEKKNESLKLSSSAVEYNVLEREVATTKDLFDSVLGRIKEIDLTSGLQDQVISVVEVASSASNQTDDPKTKIITGMVFGMALGMGLIYLLHMLDSSIKSVDQAEQALEIPALGAIPGSEPKNRLAKSRLIMMSAPSSSCAEAFRSLRANIESLGSAEKKISLFTSSTPAEGKTFTCINYALTLAQRGLKTVVIDLDLRHPSVGGEFKFEGEKLNVADIIEDPRALTQFSEENLENPAENLYVMPVGGQLANPAERLASQEVINLINKATEQFDRVVIDSAPLNPVGDTLSIVQMVDVICMVVRCKKTPVRIVQRSLETLRRFNSPASGVILNFVPSKKSMGNYYYYYGGGKSPYEGGQHYQATEQKSSPRVRRSEPSPASEMEENSPSPRRHRRRRIRRPEPIPEVSESELSVSSRD